MNNELISNDDFSLFVPDVDFRLIPANSMTSCQAYQRPISENFIKKVSSDNFDKDLLRPVRCSERDGKLYCWDGQHTISIVQRISGRLDVPVYAMVYHGLSYEREAQLFALQKKWERSLLSYDVTNALIQAKDESAIKLLRVVNSYGFELSNHSADNKIGSVKHIEKVYEKYGVLVLAHTLCLIRDTWNGKKPYLKGVFVFSLAKVLSIFSEQIDDNTFEERFSALTMNEIIQEGKRYSVTGIDYCRAIVNYYNKKGQKKLSIEKLNSAN